MISSEGLGSAINYINTKDCVPFITSPIRVFKGLFGIDNNININMRPSASGCMPFVDHLFGCANYKKAIEEQGAFFKIRNPGF